MNDSHDATNGVNGTPEHDDATTRETTPLESATTSSAADRDSTPTENLDGVSRSANPTTPIEGHQATTEFPAHGQPAASQPVEAHTLEHRTGPSASANFASQHLDGQNAPAADPAAVTGADGYRQAPAAGQYGYGQAPYGQQFGAGTPGQHGYGQAPYGQNANAPYGQAPYGQDPNAPYAQYPYGQVPPAFAKRSRRPKPWMMVTGAAVAAVIVAGAAGGAAFAIGHATGVQANSAAQQQQLTIPGGSSGSGSSGGTYTDPFGGSSGLGGGTSTGGGTSGNGSSGTGTVPSSATAATAAEKQGLVTIVSTLNYDESSKSAGTGMIMTSNGEILTNNHVVQGATSITVTVVSTGKSYTADVVGTDATHDVAVLKLQNASGLTPVSFGQNATVKTGDSIHSTGNAEGTGSLVTAKGTVTATKQSITVQSESGSGTESLSNLIEISADVVSGDSGGPLRNADGKVIGIVTAASSGTADVTGYAIPIASALSIAKDILAGNASSDIIIGLPAFLGAEISSAGAGTGTTGSGVTIAGTVTGSAAAKAGLTAGDTITAVGGTTITDSTSLTTAIQSHKVGDSVSITYTDTAGASHTVTVTLGSGPAA